MTTTKRNTMLALIIAVIAAICAFAVTVFLSGSAQTAQAEAANSEDNYTFTLVTDEDGNSSYKVAINPTLRNTVTVAVIPDTYNGLPVTELANNAFMSCKMLTRVVLPSSVTKIGTNAFINCTQLKLVNMPSVESIGATAFSMCTSLDRLYIPKSVKSVGANILRNNANTVFVQSAADDLGDGWSSAWNNYHTGDVVYEAAPEDSIGYREIYNEANTELIGYEVCEGQSISTADADVVIYNAYRPNESSDYLPVLNICQDAFAGVTLNSLTIKARPDDDDDFPVFNHKINIRSNAFFFSFINSINIETDVTFNHPSDLQVGPTENMLGDAVTGDENGHSVGVFEESLMEHVTLPASLGAVYDKMFYHCTSLEDIKIAGQEYDGTNRLPNVTAIGDGAFDSCGYVRNLYIPSTVAEMGSSVFNYWGTALELDLSQRVKQEINIDFFEQTLPSGWSESWKNGINNNNVTINYKEMFVTIDLCDGSDETVEVSVAPDVTMPNIEVPVRNGYEFKGVYSEPNGEGFQYYTSTGVGARAWSEDGPETLYVYWEIIEYTITYVDSKNGVNPNAAVIKYTIETPTIVFAAPTGVKGYNGKWNPASIPQGSTGDKIITATWSILDYSITYVNLKDGINPNEGRNIYSVDTPTIVFAKPYGREGYTGDWDIKEIPQGSTGEKIITAVWTPIPYNITYVINYGTNPNAHITTYTIESATINFAPPYGRNYYTGAWNISSIPKGSTGNKTITAIWTPIEYNVTYNLGVSGLINNNPTKVTYESVVQLQPVARSGYMLVGWKLNGQYVESLSNVTKDIELVAVWSSGKTVYMDASMKSLYVSADDMTIRMPLNNYTSGCRITVDSNVSKVTLSSGGGVVYSVYIELYSRHSDMNLCLNSVKIASPDSDIPTVYMPTHTLLISASGNCAIYGHDGANGYSSGVSGKYGGVAISCNSINIKQASDLVIRGGNGGNGGVYGGYGGSGAYAIEASGQIYVTTDHVSLIGGNGGNGAAGGSSIGRGAAATNKTISNYGYSVTITAGSNGSVIS